MNRRNPHIYPRIKRLNQSLVTTMRNLGNSLLAEMETLEQYGVQYFMQEERSESISR